MKVEESDCDEYDDEEGFDIGDEDDIKIGMHLQGYSL